MKNARDSDKAGKKSFERYREDLENEHKTLQEMHDSKSELLSGAEDELSAKKTQLEESTETKEDDEEFLEELMESCAAKTKEYEKRKMLRANEEAAIAEAIAILNSDDAFAAFAKTDATSTGATGFLQTRTQQSRSVSVEVEKLLSSASVASKSVRLKQIASMLNSKNPFNRVIAEIEEMLSLIEEEGKEDKKQLDWCNEEREANDGELKKRVEQIDTLESEITDIDDEINNPETGLKTQLKTAEEDLVKNGETQATENKTRKEEYKDFLKDIANLKQAQSILKRAIAVLKRYYAAMEKQTQEEDFTQVAEEPATWEGAYEGQSTKGKEVLDMLEFILGESEKEEKEAQDDEESSKSTFDDSMETLKEEETNLQEQIATLEETLAEKEKDLLNKKQDLKETEHAKQAVEKYIEEIKPGCDFIIDNFDEREENRKIETAALEKADTLIKDTPAYKKFEKEKEER